MSRLYRQMFGIMFVVVALSVAGCTTVSVSRTQRLHPDSDDQLGGTGIDSTDVRSIAQRMARAIVDLPAVSQAKSKPRILILPVRNKTRFRIEADMFTVTIRDLLIQNAADRVVFLDRNASTLPSNMLDNKAQASWTPAYTKEQLEKVNYYLKGEIHSISKASRGGVSDWIHYSFMLVDTKTSDILWSGSYETKKEGLSGIIYQ